MQDSYHLTATSCKTITLSLSSSPLYSLTYPYTQTHISKQQVLLMSPQIAQLAEARGSSVLPLVFSLPDLYLWVPGTELLV